MYPFALHAVGEETGGAPWRGEAQPGCVVLWRGRRLPEGNQRKEGAAWFIESILDLDFAQLASAAYITPATNQKNRERHSACPRSRDHLLPKIRQHPQRGRLAQ